MVPVYEPEATLNVTGPEIPHAPRNCIALSMEAKLLAPVPAGSIVYVPLNVVRQLVFTVTGPTKPEFPESPQES